MQAIDERRLLALAAAHKLTIRVEPAVGSRVVQGAPLAGVSPDASEHTDGVTSGLSQITGAFQIGYERTMQSDISFGFRQLVDIAVKALSPGVNDPTTAVHAIGHLASLLVLTGSGPIGPRAWIGQDGGGRVEVPDTDFPGYLDLACGQIRRYGAGEPAVMSELLRMLHDVVRGCPGHAEAEAIQREASMIVAAATREVSEDRDLEEIHRLELDLLKALSRR